MPSTDKRALVVAALLRYVVGLVLLSVLLFGPAGTLAYWQAWVYLAILFVPMGLAFGYLVRHDPELLRRRLSAREREASQRTVQLVGVPLYFAGFLLPGFDQRLGWSQVPSPVVVAAAVVFLCGYLLFFLVLRENSFAARVVEVSAGQRLVSTGPYARVRHPMYVAIALMFLATPLVLGSWWGLLPMAGVVLILVVRIRGEEAVLLRELEGYRAYTERTRYRLLPGIW